MSSHINPFPGPGIFFRQINVPATKKLASLAVWRLRPDWTEVRFGMSPWASRARTLARVSLSAKRYMETTLPVAV